MGSSVPTEARNVSSCRGVSRDMSWVIERAIYGDAVSDKSGEWLVRSLLHASNNRRSSPLSFYEIYSLFLQLYRLSSPDIMLQRLLRWSEGCLDSFGVDRIDFEPVCLYNMDHALQDVAIMVADRFDFSVVVEECYSQNLGTVMDLCGPGAKEPSTKLRMYTFQSEGPMLMMHNVKGCVELLY